MLKMAERSIEDIIITILYHRVKNRIVALTQCYLITSYVTAFIHSCRLLNITRISKSVGIKRESFSHV